MSHGGDDEIHEEHEEHVNHEAWVIPYADLLTLLMAMFIALFAMSTVDVTKFKAFAIGFNEALGGGKLDAGIGGTANATSTGVGQGSGNGPLERRHAASRSTVVVERRRSCSRSSRRLASNKAQAAAQRQTLDDVQKQIDDGREQARPRRRGAHQGAQQRAAGHAAHRPGAVPERPGRPAAAGPAAAERDRRGAEVDRQLDRDQRLHRQRAHRSGRAVPVQPVSVVVPRRRGRRLLRVDRPRPGRGCSRPGRGDQDFDRVERDGRGPGARTGGSRSSSSRSS